MTGKRVFHIANEFKVDTYTVIEVLHDLGESGHQPESRLSDDNLVSVRAVLKVRQTRREARAEAIRLEEERNATRRAEEQKRREEKLKRAALNDYLLDAQRRIPWINRALLELLEAITGENLPPVLVIYYDRTSEVEYGLCDLEGNDWHPTHPQRRHLRAVKSELRKLNQRYLSAQNVVPVDSYWIAISHLTGTAWHADTLAKVQHMHKFGSQHLFAATLEPVGRRTPALGPPRLAERSRPITPAKAFAIWPLLGSSTDRPEEAFLIDESLLRLAVDSLDGASVFAPLPVHMNAMWVFSRPVVMRRPDGSERHVGVLWFREGSVVWRLKTYTAGGSDFEPNTKEVGEQLSGRVPFVPKWDESRPEQKLISAIWALMSQGDVAENEQVEHDRRGEARTVHEGGNGPGGLTVVRVKAGTPHASAYGNAIGEGAHLDGTWTVRGHWRQQPYPSLGVDDEGRTLTKPVWIASYTKGSEGSIPGKKVILVRA